MSIDLLERWRRLNGARPNRVSGAEPMNRLPCEWCKKVVMTTEEEIWCGANKTGRIVRLCDDCKAMCAGG